MISQLLDGTATLAALNAEEMAALLSAAAEVVLIIDARDVVAGLASNLERGLDPLLADWRGRALMELVEPGSRAALRNMLKAARARRHSLRQVLRHPLAGQEALPVAYVAQAVGADGCVVFLGRDQREIEQMQTRALSERSELERRRRELQRDELRLAAVNSGGPAPAVSAPDLHGRLVALLEQLSDAAVLTDVRGVVAWCNASFRRLVGCNEDACIDGQALTDYLQCDQLELASVLANLRRHVAGQTLRGAVRGADGNLQAVSVSITSMHAEPLPGIGFVLRAIAEQGASSDALDVDLFRSAEQLTEMVGKVPLKGMVRDATDKVEKMCIEAALRLTGNNRALAAKVLGMSRQGLYQKLHQHQLSDSDEAAGLDEN